VLVVGIGATVLRARLARRRQHEHTHGHDHHQHHGESPSFRSLLAVGVSGGLLPCPSALVVLLAAISLHRVAFGLLLILAFSAGLALSITGIGLVAVLARKAFRRLSFEGPLIRLLPAASALVILAAGAAMTLRAFPKVT
jgi:ABC-type nickel/cobalt efflux system permease component RcnA